MASSEGFFRTPTASQGVLRLVDLFTESTEYERFWCLPFNSLSFTAEENDSDPSWVDLPEEKKRIFYRKGTASFTSCNTPMRIRYTKENLHYCIHFRFELFPGVDLFSGIRSRWVVEDKEIIGKIVGVFSQTDPLKKLAMAQEAALSAVLKYWPVEQPLDFKEMAEFSKLLEYVRANLSSRLGVAEMARFMGWSEDHFSRKFSKVFRITPKQYLVRELLAGALELLKDPNITVREAAEELKFSSEFNFSRFVRHYAGKSPSSLRCRNVGK